MSKSLRRLAVLGLLLGAPAAAGAQGLTGYNVFTFGGFTQMNTEVNGTLAVGGNFSSTHSGIGTWLSAPQPNGSLVVAGNATMTGGTFNQGGIYIAGQRNFTNVGNTGLVLPQATALPVDFQSEYDRLYAHSMQLGAMSANGTTTAQYSQLFFHGTAMTNVFTVTQAQLAQANGGYNFHVPVGSTMIVNVTGLSGGTLFQNTGFNFCSFASSVTNFSNCQQPAQGLGSSPFSNLLWNIDTPTPLALAFNGSMRGSVLAPNVDISGTYGSCVGDFVANSITGNCEFYQHAYTGYLPENTATVPEPSTVALTAAGLVALGVAARRKRGLPSA